MSGAQPGSDLPDDQLLDFVDSRINKLWDMTIVERIADRAHTLTPADVSKLHDLVQVTP